jgi:tight adherence protein C
MGGTLMALSFRRVLKAYPPRLLPEAYRNRHIRLLEWMIRKNVLRIPGACLIDSMRPWVIGETVGFLVLLLGYSLDRTASGVLRAAPFAFLLGACGSWLSLRGASRLALRTVHRDLPVACFLLSLLLESGMGASAALQETASSIPPGPLSRELGELVRSRSLGVSRGESIERSRQRVPLEDYRLFLNHILQGERFGIGLSKSLRGISGKMLETQDHRAETIAQQAAVKLLFPLVCFIFPAVFLIILSPVILGIWNNFLR